MEKFKPTHGKLDVFQIDAILLEAGIRNVKNVSDYLHLCGSTRHDVEFYIKNTVPVKGKPMNVNMGKFFARLRKRDCGNNKEEIKC